MEAYLLFMCPHTETFKVDNWSDKMDLAGEEGKFYTLDKAWWKSPQFDELPMPLKFREHFSHDVHFPDEESFRPL